MQLVNALSWAPVGESLQATVICDFGVDLAWQIAINGSLGQDYYKALSVDIDGGQLAAGVGVLISFNQIDLFMKANDFRTYSLAPYQRYFSLVATAGAPNILPLTFYNVVRPEWR